MIACVVSPGVVHAVSRTLAMSHGFDSVHFIDIAGKANRELLESRHVHYHGPESSCAVLGRKDLTRLLNDIMPDIIICHFVSGDHYFSAIAWGRCPVAVIAMGQDVLYEAGDNRVGFMQRLLTRMALRRSCYISAKSEFLARRIRSFGVMAPVEVNYWGADLEHFSPGDRGAARRQLGWDEGGIYLLSPRAIEPRLNIDVIVDAFATVLGQYPRANLVVLGRSDPGYLQRIEAQIDGLGIGERVMLLGEVNQHELPVYYRASDMVLSMARSEGFPNTVLEVMACGIPVIVGDIDQVGELLEHGTNAVICPIAVGPVTDSVLGLLEDRALADRISAGGLSTVLQYADIARNGAAFAGAMGKLLVDAGSTIPLSGSFGFRQVYHFSLLLRKLTQSRS